MRRELIEEWMEKVLATESHRAFVDLHIDDIDRSWSDRSRWLSGALSCLEAALLIKRRRGWTVTAAVGFSLRSHRAPRGLQLHSYQDLQAELDSSPPSLYLFLPGEEPWHDDADFQTFEIPRSLPTNHVVRAYLREWYDENDEDYRRSFWLAG